MPKKWVPLFLPLPKLFPSPPKEWKNSKVVGQLADIWPKVCWYLDDQQWDHRLHTVQTVRCCHQNKMWHCTWLFLFLSFSFVKAVGVCFLAVCEGTYPAVLVFCFLEELQREFMITFQGHDVQRARRPYSFIEFGKHVSKPICNHVVLNAIKGNAT